MKYLNCKILIIYSLIANISSAAPFASSTITKSNNTTNITPLQISSQNIQAEKTNITKYSGNVEILKGTVAITADTAIMQNKQGIIMISGNPAKLTDLVSAKEQIQASAQTMNFDNKSNKIILKGNASITKNGKAEKDKKYIIYSISTHDYEL